MPERKSRSKQQKSTISLRRSPRFRPINQSDPKVPAENLKQRKLHVADSFSTSLGSLTNKTPPKSGGISQTRETNGGHSSSSAKSRKGSRKSDSGGYGSIIEEGQNLQKQFVVEKRVTRSSVSGSINAKNQVNECVTEDGSSERFNVRSKECKDNLGVGPWNQCVYSIERRVTRSLTQKKLEKGATGSDLSLENVDKVVIKSDEPELKTDVELSKPRLSKRHEKPCDIKWERGNMNGRRKMRIGEKRKRNEVGEVFDDFQGWTNEQELALRKAYFTAKPTPHFWKKVARMVPGKSAEECFDRIHADHMTPPQARTRPMANKTRSSPLSFSASKLLKPAETELKKLRFTKRKTLMAQKTVRQLLQKQQNEDHEHETDLFAVLEKATDGTPLNFQGGVIFSSPTPSQGFGNLTKCREISSSIRKKHLSRLSGSGKAAFVSPPVLKQVKNKALHEKYIDQLHFRDAKRRVQSLKNAKLIQGKNDVKVTDLKPNPVKLAKESLIFEAEDAINQFRTLQSRATYEFEDNISSGEEDEAENGIL